MTEASIPESELQAWFEAASRSGQLHSSIENCAELEAWAQQLVLSNRHTEKTSREGVANALRVCNVLSDADHLSANRSIAPPGCAQMRPDLVLTSHSGHHILVELKTQSGPERQGVQELLAYSAAIKMQAPYVNDFMYVIVANHWDDLLGYAVRSLIVDGKHVLPLEFTRRGENDFTLRIRLDLFRFSFVQYFHTMYAMVPALLGVYRAAASVAPVEPVNNYLYRVATSAVDDCVRLNQSGFAMIWSLQEWFNDSELAYTTLVTVNQHWRFSEHLPGNYPRYIQEKPHGFHGYLHRIAHEQGRAAYRGATADDIWAWSDSTEEAATRVHKQSALSYEVLARHRNRKIERHLESSVPLKGSFDDTEFPNLEVFMLEFADSAQGCMSISAFRAFGELADYMRDAHRKRPTNHRELGELLEAFHRYKQTQPDATPDQIPPEMIVPSPPEFWGSF